jgi:hypothetical protein
MARYSEHDTAPIYALAESWKNDCLSAGKSSRISKIGVYSDVVRVGALRASIKYPRSTDPEVLNPS